MTVIAAEGEIILFQGLYLFQRRCASRYLLLRQYLTPYPRPVRSYCTTLPSCSKSLIIPRVTRSTKTSKKQPNRNTSSSHLHSPHMRRSPSTSKSKPSKFSPKVRVRKMVRDKLSKDDDIFNDIEDIDKRLIALQGFLKDAKESRQFNVFVK